MPGLRNRAIILFDFLSLALWRFSFYPSQKKCRPLGSEALPEGIVSKTSNLEMRPLWGDVEVTSYFGCKLFMSFFISLLTIFNL